MNEKRVLAAAREIYDAGLHYRWSGFTKPFDNLDPIGREEFLGIVERALAAADQVEKQNG